MSDAHAADRPDTAADQHDTAADHHDTHGDPVAGGHDDDHGEGHEHGGDALGPIDVAAWGAGLLGLLVGGVTALAFVLSTGRL